MVNKGGTDMQTAGSSMEVDKSQISMRPSPVTLPKIVLDDGDHETSCTTSLRSTLWKVCTLSFFCALQSCTVQSALQLRKVSRSNGEQAMR